MRWQVHLTTAEGSGRGSQCSEPRKGRTVSIWLAHSFSDKFRSFRVHHVRAGDTVLQIRVIDVRVRWRYVIVFYNDALHCIKLTADMHAFVVDIMSNIMFPSHVYYRANIKPVYVE